MAQADDQNGDLHGSRNEEKREMPEQPNGLTWLLRNLYFGRGAGPRAFRWTIFGFDVVMIVYFLLTATLPLTPAIILIDLCMALVVALDILARFWIDRQKSRFLRSFHNLVDLLVLASLLAPLLFQNLAFLRVLRALRFLRSYHTVRELRRLSGWFREHERVITAATNLAVFVFIVTSIVWVLEHDINEQINSFTDALYFTVTTLTTTGFGDIILQDPLGRLLTIAIMVFGVALFLRLVQQIFRPSKVSYTCPECGLTRHDPDASHCKHCGNVVYIRTEGEG